LGSFSRRMIEGLIREGVVRPILGILGVHRLVAGFLIAAFATATDASGASAAGEPTLVQIDGGEVRGTAANGVMAFKGIPFAQPPVGALRWRPPQPVAPWKGILKASQLQFDCPQPSSLLPSASKGTSEDCLYINVWHRASAGDKPLPVMVWIHGGGLVRGAASPHPGDFLARQGLVCASFNCRLGRLGFFAHPALASETPEAPRGNYGYMDQIRSNVTIAGESVLAMLTSPMARGLFRRVILQSPGIPTPRAGALPMRSLAAAEKIAGDYARSLGVTTTTRRRSPSFARFLRRRFTRVPKITSHQFSVVLKYQACRSPSSTGGWSRSLPRWPFAPVGRRWSR